MLEACDITIIVEGKTNPKKYIYTIIVQNNENNQTF